MESTVSVIIPTYNRAALIGQTIRNMLDQTLAPHEIIVVDDGSTDATSDVVSSFGSKVRYLPQRNRGPAAARNAGLAAATGRYVQFMDSDDLASLNKLEEQMKALETNGADMAYGPWIQLRIAGNHATAAAEVLQGTPPPPRLALYEWHLRGWALVLQNCLFRREFLGRVGPFHEDLMMTEDTEYLNRIFVSDPTVAFTPSCMVLYRVHDDNKLTHSGTTASHKAIHWARALNYMLENLETRRKALRLLTRLNVGLLGWRIQSQLRAIAGGGQEPFERLHAAVRRFPSPAYRLLSLWQRGRAAISRRLTGSAWPRSYGARPVSAEDLRMITAIGITIAPPNDADPAQALP
jgi:glycosyltransferase involved in cell wall biosynthesis